MTSNRANLKDVVQKILSFSTLPNRNFCQFASIMTKTGFKVDIAQASSNFNFQVSTFGPFEKTISFITFAWVHKNK